LEIDVSAAVLVEDRDHACCQRVGGDLGELQEFFALDCAGAVLREEPVSESPRIKMSSILEDKSVLCRVS
jgi:hypothetical protein